MKERLDFLVLLHLLVEKKIITVEEAKIITSLSTLDSFLIKSGILTELDFTRVRTYYIELIKLVADYMRCDTSRRQEIFDQIIKLMGGDDVKQKQAGG